MQPEYAIINEREIDGFRVVEVDTGKATFQGKPWKSLGEFGRRKFENLLVLSRSKEHIKVTYVSPII